MTEFYIMNNIDLLDSTVCRICLKKSNKTTSIFEVLEIYFKHNFVLQRVPIVDIILECSSIDKVLNGFFFFDFALQLQHSHSFVHLNNWFYRP